ncbi:hypothetical protein SRHO_G00055620 [Serrasalmus rhombeus]
MAQLAQTGACLPTNRQGRGAGVIEEGVLDREGPERVLRVQTAETAEGVSATSDSARVFPLVLVKTTALCRVSVSSSQRAQRLKAGVKGLCLFQGFMWQPV